MDLTQLNNDKSIIKIALTRLYTIGTQSLQKLSTTNIADDHIIHVYLFTVYSVKEYEITQK